MSMPIYTFNLFDIIPDKLQLYRQYSIQAGKVIFSLGGKVVCSGWHPSTLRGDTTRGYFIIVEFPSLSTVESFLHDPQNEAIHQMREESTENYIWKIFEPWDLRRWVAFPSVK